MAVDAAPKNAPVSQGDTVEERSPRRGWSLPPWARLSWHERKRAVWSPDPEQWKLDDDWEAHREIVWQHAIHDDQVFNSHLNFFLVFEGLLLAAFVTLATNGDKTNYLLLFVGFAGVISSIMWIVVQAKSILHLEHPVAALEHRDPYYKMVVAQRSRSVLTRIGVNTWALLGYGIPSLSLLLWSMLVLFHFNLRALGRFMPVLFLGTWFVVGRWTNPVSSEPGAAKECEQRVKSPEPSSIKASDDRAAPA